MDQTKRAHDLITRHADADSSWDEIYMLLCENGIPEDVAHEVTCDVRGDENPELFI